LRFTGFLLGAALWLAGVASPGPPPALKVTSDRPVPESLETLSDLRWAGPDSLYLAAGPAGALKVRIEPGWGGPQVVFPGDAGVWAAARIGASGSHLAVGAPGMVVGWRRLPGGPVRILSFDLVVDLDVFKDKVVLLGARKDERGRFAPDGAIAWLGSLDLDSAGLRPVRYSATGPGARAMDACGAFETGAVRFLADGSFLVVPGVEPGAFLYDPKGKLSRAWEAKDIGLDAGCGLTDEQMYHLSADLKARLAWINQRRVLEDIVPLPEGAGLIVRTAAGGQTRWDLKLLRRDGEVSSQPLPWTGPSPDWHLRADVRGDRLAVLLKEYAVGRPGAPSRLILADLAR
jgi:hypothetical protein